MICGEYKYITELGFFLFWETIENMPYQREKRKNPKNTALVDRVLEDINMIPISSSLKVFAKCKAHLRKIGKIVDDADILIGATAIDNKFVMVTENIKHFENLPGITLENWVKR